MKLAYQISTPDVRPAPGVTAYQDELAVSFARLAEVGYDGAELMVCNPGTIDRRQIETLCREYRLEVPMVCTGEVFGQDRLSFSDPDDAIRSEAISRVRDAIDLASSLGALVNIGRVRGGLVPGVPPEKSRRRSIDALRTLCEYADSRKVTIALEPVNSLAINFINSTRDGLEILREVAHDRFSLMLDSAHMFIEDYDLRQSVVEAASVVSYVHLCDSNRKYPGQCKIDFGSFIGSLRGIRYDGYASVEVFQIPDQDTALRKSFEHIKPLL